MFTVIIPTHDHQDTLIYSIQSVLNQTYQDFEIFVVGDGAPARTKSIVHELTLNDSRIRYFENAKGEGHGEQHRADALKLAKGEFVAYCGDDDLWFPNHLETLLPVLSEFDFAQTTQPSLTEYGEQWNFHAGDLNNDATRKRMRNKKQNFFGPTTVAHRLDAYLKLPHGWQPKPEGMFSDLHMWRQWLSQDWVRFKSLFKVTVLHLSSDARVDVTIAERCKEMKYWLRKMENPDFEQWVAQQQIADWNRKTVVSVRPGSLIEIAKNLHKTGNYLASCDLCKIIIEAEPHRHGIHSLLIKSLIKLNHVKEAKEHLAEALSLFPDAPAFNNYEQKLNELDL